jgi:oligopeptide/dipeptide ABC transporter ATP-binding protein
MSAFLQIEHLRVELGARGKRKVHAVQDVSFSLDKNKCLVIIGESGSGKSTVLKSIMGLLPKRDAAVSGRIVLEGTELTGLREKDMEKMRGNDIAMVFQGAMSILDPVYTIGEQIAEVLKRHRNMRKKEAYLHALELMRLVGIPSPEERMKAYPHQLSGGMKQRIMMAIALACQPKLLLADEPTTALDVTIQSQILYLLRKLQRELEMTVVLVTHDIGVASVMADEIAVMYAGQIVEYGPAQEVLSRPSHPYTIGLIEANAIPERGRRLYSIPGQPPDLTAPGDGCAFAERCRFAGEVCFARNPARQHVTSVQWSKCFLAEELREPMPQKIAVGNG